MQEALSDSARPFISVVGKLPWVQLSLSCHRDETICQEGGEGGISEPSAEHSLTITSFKESTRCRKMGMKFAITLTKF